MFGVVAKVYCMLLDVLGVDVVLWVISRTFCMLLGCLGWLLRYCCDILGGC